MILTTFNNLQHYNVLGLPKWQWCDMAAPLTAYVHVLVATSQLNIIEESQLAQQKK